MAVVLNQTLKSTKPAGSMKVNGLHHLALYTHDMDATTHFYADVLDLPLVLTDAPAGGMLERHYFFDVGAGGASSFIAGSGSRLTLLMVPPPSICPRGIFRSRSMRRTAFSRGSNSAGVFPF